MSHPGYYVVGQMGEIVQRCRFTTLDKDGLWEMNICMVEVMNVLFEQLLLIYEYLHI